MAILSLLMPLNLLARLNVLLEWLHLHLFMYAWLYIHTTPYPPGYPAGWRPDFENILILTV